MHFVWLAIKRWLQADSCALVTSLRALLTLPIVYASIQKKQSRISILECHINKIVQVVFDTIEHLCLRVADHFELTARHCW